MSGRKVVKTRVVLAFESLGSSGGFTMKLDRY